MADPYQSTFDALEEQKKQLAQEQLGLVQAASGTRDLSGSQLAAATLVSLLPMALGAAMYGSQGVGIGGKAGALGLESFNNITKEREDDIQKIINAEIVGNIAEERDLMNRDISANLAKSNAETSLITSAIKERNRTANIEKEAEARAMAKLKIEDPVRYNYLVNNQQGQLPTIGNSTTGFDSAAKLPESQQQANQPTPAQEAVRQTQQGDDNSPMTYEEALKQTGGNAYAAKKIVEQDWARKNPRPRDVLGQADMSQLGKYYALTNRMDRLADQLLSSDMSWEEWRGANEFTGLDKTGLGLLVQATGADLGYAKSGATMNEQEAKLNKKILAGDVTGTPRQVGALLKKLNAAYRQDMVDRLSFAETLGRDNISGVKKLFEQGTLSKGSVFKAPWGEEVKIKD